MAEGWRSAFSPRESVLSRPKAFCSRPGVLGSWCPSVHRERLAQRCKPAKVDSPPPRLAGVPHPRRRTVGLERASAGLRTLEAASPAAKARFSSLPLCGEALPRLSAEGNRAGANQSAGTYGTVYVESWRC